jgi:hypothetical protein
MSFRRLQVYIDYLPPESATKSEVRDSFTAEQLAQAAEATPDSGHGSWSRAELLLASVIDQLAFLRHEAIAMRTPQPGKPPTPYPRPGIPRAGSLPEASPAAMAYLEQIRERNRNHRLAETGA